MPPGTGGQCICVKQTQKKRKIQEATVSNQSVENRRRFATVMICKGLSNVTVEYTSAGCFLWLEYLALFSRYFCVLIAVFAFLFALPDRFSLKCLPGLFGGKVRQELWLQADL